MSCLVQLLLFKMNTQLVLLSVVCASYLVVPASGVSLLAAAASAAGTVKGAILGAGLAGIGGLSQPPQQETVIINAQPSKPYIEINGPPSSVPVQVVPYYPNRPVQVAALPNPPLFGGLWTSIQSAILTKAQAVAGLISSLKPQQQQQIIVVVNNTKPATTTHKPTIFEIVLPAEPRIQPVALPVPVFLNKK